MKPVIRYKITDAQRWDLQTRLDTQPSIYEVKKCKFSKVKYRRESEKTQ